MSTCPFTSTTRRSASRTSRITVPAGQYSEITQWGDGIYVFPCTTAGEVLFYNKTMFDKYGLEAPKTWTELAECSKIIHEKEGIPGFGTDSLVDTYQCLIMQAGSGYIDEDGNYAIDETIAKEKLNWFADLVKSGDFRLVGEDVFFSGRSAARPSPPTSARAPVSAMLSWL